MIEIRESPGVIPDILAGSAEYVRAVLVDVYAVHLFRMAVAAYMPPSVQHEDAQTRFSRFMRHDGTEQTRADDDQIAMLHVAHRPPLSKSFALVYKILRSGM